MPSALYGNIPLSAATATIKFDSQVVGYLQNLRITENFNVKQVNSLGSNQGVAYLLGSYEGTATARKAFVELDLILDILKPGLTTDEALLYGLEYTYPAGTDRDTTRSQIGDVTEKFKALSLLLDTLRGKRASRRDTFVSTFEIQVDSYALNDDGTPVSDLVEKPIILLQDCIITSRDIDIDVNNLVVMQNVSIRFLRREI